MIYRQIIARIKKEIPEAHNFSPKSELTVVNNQKFHRFEVEINDKYVYLCVNFDGSNLEETIKELKEILC